MIKDVIVTYRIQYDKILISRSFKRYFSYPKNQYIILWGHCNAKHTKGKNIIFRVNPNMSSFRFITVMRHRLNHRARSDAAEYCDLSDFTFDTCMMILLMKKNTKQPIIGNGLDHLIKMVKFNSLR